MKTKGGDKPTNKAKTETKPPNRRRRRALVFGTIALICLGISGLAIRKILSYKVPTVPTLFRATVHAPSLTFVLGDFSGNAGLFNSDTRRVNVTLASQTILERDDMERDDTSNAAGASGSRHCVANARLNGVKLVRVAAEENVKVALDAERGGVLRYTLTPAPGVPDPSISVIVDDKSDLRGLTCTPEAPLPGAGEWHVRSEDRGDFLEFSVNFDRQSAPTSRGASMDEPAPAPEENVPIAEQSSLLLLVDSSAATPNKLRLIRSGRELHVEEGLMLRNLSNTTMQQLSLDTEHGLLGINMAGAADHIGIKIGEDQIEEADRKYSTLGLRNMSSFASAGGALLSGVLAIFSTCATVCSAFIAYHAWQKPKKAR